MPPQESKPTVAPIPDPISTMLTDQTHLMSIVGSILGFVNAVFTRFPFDTVGVLLVPSVNTKALPGAAGTASRSFCMLYGPMKARLYS
jgi:hypothetical protein